MIGIFQGRGIADKARVHAQIDVDFRKHVHEFNDGHTFSALAVFLAIALHSNEGGWAWPGRGLLRKEVGLGEQALTHALAHLRAIHIEGYRIFAHYRVVDENKRWGASAYLIFPDLEHGLAPYPNMIEYNPAADVPLSSGFVYLVQAYRGHKLGTTKQLTQRMRKLRHSYDQDFKVLAYYQAEDSSEANAMWYKQWLRRHTRGDWFDLKSGQVREFVEYALAHGGSTKDPKGKHVPLASGTVTSETVTSGTAHEVEPSEVEPSKVTPAPKSAQVTEPRAKEPSYAPGEELEIVPVEEEEDYERASLRQKPKWQIPETQFQRDFLAVCRAKSFKPRQKTKVKKLTKCLSIGAGFLQEADGYRRCIEELEGHTDFPDRPLAMPASWYDWRAKHAKEHRWSINGFIGALFDRDALVRHCQYKLKQLGATENDERPATPAPYSPPSGPTYS